MDPTGTLADLLKQHRAAAGLTQEELAERAEVSARTISDTERGLRTSIYKDTTKRIADALGLQGEALAAFERAARGRRGTPSPAAPVLPEPPTALIGRDDDVARVAAALEGARLVTLSGPGGIGKTRVALEVAHRVSARFARRVFFVQLGGISDPKLVASEIARAIGITWAPSEILPAIVERLRDPESLLVLDTFEHLLDAAADVATILAGAPVVRVLTTSREALRVRGEQEMAVPPLARTEDATALFIARAREVDADLDLDGDARTTIASICERLDGVPLAIELAAARVKHLPLPSLLEQLEHSLDVLTGGARDLPERQRTMRDTVAWSEGMLDEDQRRLFRELSVFAGGWTLDAASAVCSERDRVTASLSGLVDKSLVLRVNDGEGARYRMLDVIREFAAELLGDQRETASRHASFFLSLAADADAAFGSASQERWIRTLAQDQDNVRVAYRWFLESGDAESALRLGGALWQFWRVRGDVVEGRDWLRRSLALPGGSVPSRGKALWGAAWLAYHQDDYDEAARYGEELSLLAASSDDPVILRNALTIPGIVAMAQGRYGDARALFERAVGVLRPIGQNWLFATSLLNLGSACVRADPGAARGLLEQAADLYERLGDRAFTARATIQIAFLSLIEGDPDEAGRLIGDSLRSFAEREDPWGTAESLEAMAAVCAANERVGDAAMLSGAADAIRSTMAVHPHPFDAALIAPYIEKARSSPEWPRSFEEGARSELDRVLEIVLHGSPSPSEAL